MSIRKGSRTIASSVPVTEWGSVDGTLTDQADLKNALDSKAEKYSPTFTGTPLAPTALVGTSNNQIATTKYVQDALLNAGSDLPDQTGQSGKFLTTNGTLPSWVGISQVPSQSGQSGKFLTTNGTTASWSTLNGVVHLTGDETIEGNKTIRNGNICLDINSTIKKNVTYTGTWARDVFELSGVDTTKFFKFGAAGLESSGNITYGFMGLSGYDSDNNIRVYSTYATAPTPTATDLTTDKKIATTGWVNSPTLSINVVHRSGDETIAGTKTFTTNYPAIKLKNLNYTINDFTENQSIGVIRWVDNNDTEISYVKAYSSTDGMLWNEFAGTYGTNVWKCGLKVGYDSVADSMFTWVPTPAANSNDNNIATTSWVNTKVSGVTLNGGNDISIDANKNINYTGPRYYRLATRTWTYSQWTQYCERGVTTNISPSFTITGIRAGDLVTVEGICSDRGNANALAWGIANGEPAAETNNVSVTFLGLNIQNDFGLVHLAGDETIAGVKTFTSTNGIVTQVSGSNNIIQKNLAIDITDTTRASEISNDFTVRDKNDYVASMFRTSFNTSGGVTSSLQARNRASGSETIGQITITVDSVGNIATSAPKPASVTDNSTQIATTSWVVDVLQAIYPVGSLYMGTQNSCPLSAFFGTWTLVSAGNALWTGNGTSGSGTTTNANYANAAANTTIAAGAPNITGSVTNMSAGRSVTPAGSGALSVTKTGTWSKSGTDSSVDIETISLNASSSNSIYGKSSTVQPPAYVVNVWRRTA